MNSKYNHAIALFFFLLQDAHTLNFREFHKTMANITLIRLVDPESQYVKNAVEEIVFNEQKSGRVSVLTPSTIKVNIQICSAYTDL